MLCDLVLFVSYFQLTYLLEKKLLRMIVRNIIQINILLKNLDNIYLPNYVNV